MNSNNGSIWYSLFLDNSKFRQSANEAKSVVGSIGNQMVQEANKIDNAYTKISNSLKFALSTSAVAMFANSVAKVRGEFQQLEISIQTLLGNKTKADALIGQLVDTAAKTPFGLQEVSKGAKQLLAYNIEAEKVNETLLKLGDIAAGMAIPLSDIVYLYGTTINQGKMNLVDYKQFLGRGIPIAEALADQFKIAKSEVADFVSAGKVGVQELNNAIDSMAKTKFNNLMEKQSQSITGQISNLKDKFDLLLNDLGSSTEGIFTSAISGTAYLIENYKSIGKTIAELVAVYGTYKATLMVISAVQKLNMMILRQVVVKKRLAATANITLSNSEAIAVAKTKLLTIAKMQLNQVTRMLNATMLANPYVLVATAVAGLVYWFYKLATHQTASEKAQEKLNESVAQFEKQTISETQNLNSLVAQLKATEKETETYNKIKSEIINKYGEYLEGLSEEKKSLEDLEGAYDAIIKKMREKHRFQGFLQGIENINKELAEKVGDAQKDIKETLIKGLGDKQGKEVYFKLLPIFEADEVNLDKVKEILDLSEDGRTIKGGVGDRLKDKGFFGNYLSDVYENIVKIKHQKSDVNKVIKEAQEEMLAISSPKKEDNDKTPTETKTAKSLQQLLKEQKENAQKIAQIRNQLKNDVDSTELNKQLEEELETQKKIKEQIERLTGDKQSSKKEKPTFDKDNFDLQTQRQIRDKELAEQKMRIQQMQESYDKELAFIQLHYDEKEEAILRGQQDALKALEKEQKDSKGLMSKLQFEARKKVIDEVADTSHQSNLQAKEQQEKKLLEQLINDYKTFEEQKADIVKKYADDEQKLRIKYEGDILEEKLKLLKEERDKDIADLQMKQKGTKNLLVEMYGDLSKKTVKELKKVNDEVQEFVKMLQKGKYEIEIGAKIGITKEMFDSTLKNADKMRDVQEKAQQISKEVEKTRNYTEKLGEAFKKVFNEEDPNRFSESLNELNSEVQKGVQTLNLLADAFYNLGDATGSDRLKDFGKALKDIGDIANATMQGAQTGYQVGGPVGAAVGAALGMISSISAKIAKHARENEQAVLKVMEEKNAQQREYNRLLFEKNMLLKSAETIFSEDKMAKALNYLNLNAQKTQELREKMQHLQNMSVKNGHIGHNWGQNLVSSVVNLFGGGKKGQSRDTYGKLLDEVKGLINPDGSLNIQVAESALQRTFADESQKKLLEDIIDTAKKAQKASEELDNYLKDTFGSLGNSFMDSIEHALLNGTDAFEEFGKSAGKVLMDLGKQMLFDKVLTQEFEKIQNRIKQTYQQGLLNGKTNQQIANEIKSVMVDSINGLKPQMEVTKSALEQWHNSLKEAGMMDDNASRQAGEKGVQRLTQDTGEEIAGQFRLLTQLSAESKTALLQISKDVAENYKFMQSHSAQQLKHLAGIETNTFTLHEIKKDITSMKNIFSDMETKGIKIR